ISPDGKLVAAATTRPTRAEGVGAYAEEVFVWGVARVPEKPEPISSHEAGAPFAGVASLAFAPDGKSLVGTFCNFVHLSRSGELRGLVRIWSVEATDPKPAPAPGAAALDGWKEKAALTQHA